MNHKAGDFSKRTLSPRSLWFRRTFGDARGKDSGNRFFVFKNIDKVEIKVVEEPFSAVKAHGYLKMKKVRLSNFLKEKNELSKTTKEIRQSRL